MRGIRGALCDCVRALVLTGCLTGSLFAQPPQFPSSRPAASTTVPAELSRTAGDSPEAGSQRLLPARQSVASGKRSKTTQPSAMPLWGTVIGLGMLACGLIVALKWIRRHGPAVMRALPNEAVEPLGQRVLSRGVAVHLVRCGNRMLILGVGPDGVRTLSEITDPVEVDLLAGACRRRDESASGLAGFSQMLQRSQRTPSSAARDSRGSSAIFPSRMGEVDGV